MLQAQNHYLHTTDWHECVIASHPPYPRRCSGEVAVAANQQRDGDTYTSAARCLGEQGTNWRVRDILGFPAQKQRSRAPRHYKGDRTGDRGWRCVTRKSGRLRIVVAGLLQADSPARNGAYL